MTGDQLRAWRAARNLSQAQLARLLGMGVRQIAKYEAGEAPIRPVVELALAEIERRHDLEYRKAAKEMHR